MKVPVSTHTHKAQTPTLKHVVNEECNEMDYMLMQENALHYVLCVQVIMLSSVTELHSYIDRTQLTQELGGTQEYCHEKWISHRTVSTLLFLTMVLMGGPLK